MTNARILVATWEDGLFAVGGEGRVQELAAQGIRGLAADGRGGALAVVGGHRLCRRSAWGEWETVAVSEIELSCCMAVGETIYAGTDDARMLRLRREDGVLEPMAGFDGVAGRDTWFAGSMVVDGKRLGPPLGVRSVAANADGSVLFANVHVGGIPRSMDGGVSWEPTIDVLSDVHEVRGHPGDPQIVVAATAVGLCISRDAGWTWTIEREGLHAPHCSAVAICGEEIFVSAAESPFAAEGRVYRRPVRLDGVITAVEGGMPAWTVRGVDTGCIAVDRALVAVADRGGNVYVSEDYGRSWSLRSRGLPAPSGVLVLREGEAVGAGR